MKPRLGSEEEEPHSGVSVAVSSHTGWWLAPTLVKQYRPAGSSSPHFW